MHSVRLYQNEKLFAFIGLFICSIILLILFDTNILPPEYFSSDHNSNGNVVFGLFSIMYVSILVFLSHKSFDLKLFCSFNFTENLCGKFPKANYTSLVRKDPLVTWSQCRMKIYKGNIVMVNKKAFL